jgi:transposase
MNSSPLSKEVPMSSKRKRTFTEEFKRDAVTLIHREAYTLKEAASRLSIHESVLGKWKRRIEKETDPLRVELNSVERDSVAEIRQLREENRRFDPSHREVALADQSGEI